MSPSPKKTAVYLEVGKKKVFACSLDWPGWCRAGKTEDLALEALIAYVPRYSVVAEVAGVPLPNSVDHLTVVERVAGNATTDFGAPGVVPEADLRPTTGHEAHRAAALVKACWTVFDRVVAEAPAELRKGPRGGGRDRDKIVDHVLGAEVGYGRMIGVKHRQPERDDAVAIQAHRHALLDLFGAPSSGQPVREKGWPVRYAARRIAWHVLDHAWEIEDKSEPAQ